MSSRAQNPKPPPTHPKARPGPDNSLVGPERTTLRPYTSRAGIVSPRLAGETRVSKRDPVHHTQPYVHPALPRSRRTIQCRTS